MSESERLRFTKNELPPPFNPAIQPKLPINQWSEERLVKANRNYAIEYIRNGIRELSNILGQDRSRELGSLAAKLTGLQYYQSMSRTIGATDGDCTDAANFLSTMLQGMGDATSVSISECGSKATLVHSRLRILRGIKAENEREDLLTCWIELWRGAVQSHQKLLKVTASIYVDRIEWIIEER
ncbi:MAG: hypothetical protein ACI92E_003049 [Oceanicoccus sp.]